MDTLIEYLKVFAVGGALCAAGEILVDKTRLTPARILSIYVVAGVILGAVGVYRPLIDFAGPGPPCPSPASAACWPRA
jgi:stage V sporulation protein AE